ncbi:MAG: proline dehydrogenase [Anaerolineales bacterium]
MLRSLFISLSKAQWAKDQIVQREFFWKMATRFVAGETLESAIQAAQALNTRGINATLDHLGEFTSNPDEARQAADDVIVILNAVRQAGVRASVSIKLSQMGLMIDKALCAENLHRVLQAAREHGNFVRIDMEDATTVDDTLALYRQMRSDGFENLGLVQQAYLYRVEADLTALLAENAHIRLCKGAYKEPPHVAYPKKSDVDLNYDRLARMMLEAAVRQGAPRLSADGLTPPPPAIATHDEVRIAYVKRLVADLKLPKDALEFQMLYGIRRDLQTQLAVEGYPVRVYVPYGTQWYPYFMRRLAERPANVWFLLSNLTKH